MSNFVSLRELKPGEHPGIVIDLYSSGKSLREVADIFGVSQEWIRLILLREDYRYRHPRRGPVRVPDVPWNCQQCGIKQMVRPHLARDRKYCSHPCAKLGQRNGKSEEAYRLRSEEKLPWEVIGKRLGWADPAGVAATNSAKRYALTEGLPWPIPGVDYRRKTPIGEGE